MAASRLYAIVLLPAFVVSCNALSGIGDLTADDDAGSIDLPDSDRSAVDDASDGGSNPIDAAPAPPPTCTCMPSPPDGWSALSLLVTRDGASPATCPTGLSPTMTGGVEPKGGCSPCACGTVTGACTVAILQTGKNTCSSPCTEVSPNIGPKPVTTACSPITYCNSASAASAYMAPDAGSCPPSGGTLVAAAFTKSGTACGFASAPAGSCANGEACAPKSEGAPNAPVCIARVGDNACPAGAYSVKSLYYGAVDDKRSCSPCTCGAPNTTCTPATIAIYTGDSCGNQVDNVTTVASTCATFSVPLPPGSAKITTPSTLITNTGCAPSGGAATGELLGKNPTTVCCTK